MRILYFILFCLVVINASSQSYLKTYEDYYSAKTVENYQKSNELRDVLIRKHAKELSKNPMQYAEIANDLGNSFYEENKFDSAYANYSKAVNLVYSIKADTSLDYALYLFNASNALSAVGSYTLAEKYYLVALPKLAGFLGASSLEYTMFYKEYVEMKIEMGDYNAAVPMNDALLYYFKTLKGENDVHYLVCINNKARIYQGKGDYHSAASYFMQALDGQLKYYPSDTMNIAIAYNNAAECHRMTGNYSAAESLYMEAYKLESTYSKNKKEDFASLLNNMALLYKSQSNYSQAEKCFLKSIDYYVAANYQNTAEITNPINNLGDLYRIIGNYKMAIQYVEQAVVIRKNTSGENHEYYANALVNLALLYNDLEYYNDAENLLLTAEKIYKDRLGESNVRYASCLSNLSSIYLNKKDFSKALGYKNRCLKLMENNGAQNTDKYALYLSGKGSIEAEMKNYDTSVKTFSKAADIFKQNFGAQNFNYIDMIYSIANIYDRANKNKEARNHYLISMYGYKKIIEDNFVTMSEEEKANFYHVISNRVQSFYSFAIDQVNDKLFAKDDSLFKAVLDVRMFDKSLLLSENTNIYKAMLNSVDTTLKRTFNQWQEQKNYLQQLYKYSFKELNDNNINIDQEEDLKNSLEKTLSEKSSLFKSTKNTTNYFLQIKNKLSQTDIAIEIIKSALITGINQLKVNYAALIIGKDFSFPKLIPLDSCNYFDSLFISHYKNSIENQTNDYLSYNRFFKPLEQHLNGVSNIYFSGEGIYQQLNLYSLLNPSNNKYLIETAEITQLNSLKDLLQESGSQSGNHTVALFGYPNYELKTEIKKSESHAVATRFGFDEFPELPGTKKETEDIAAIFKEKNWNTKLYLSNEATEEQVKQLNSPTILHIATHGFFLPDEDFGDEKVLGFDVEQARQNPLLRSGLVMAGAAAYAKENSINLKEDGVLNAYEASLLNLQNTELVTLSACETGLGEMVNGQGVYGLQRAFLTAGAKSLLMSLWVVDDAATQELMTEFYKDWLINYSLNNKRASLRKAQLAIKQKYPHPYYWGAFVMLGK